MQEQSDEIFVEETTNGQPFEERESENIEKPQKENEETDSKDKSDENETKTE